MHKGIRKSWKTRDYQITRVLRCIERFASLKKTEVHVSGPGRGLKKYIYFFFYSTRLFSMLTRSIYLCAWYVSVCTPKYTSQSVLRRQHRRAYTAVSRLVVKCTLRSARACVCVSVCALCAYGSFTKSVLGFYVHARDSYITDGAHITCI